MTKFNKTPSTKELLTAYNSLQGHKRLKEGDLIKYSHWSRYDPRLGEQLIVYLSKNWSLFNPLVLAKINSKSTWPQTLCVILDHVSHLKIKDKKIFELFKQMVTLDINPVNYQSYFIGLYKIGGDLILDQSVRPHPLFLKWGYYAAEPMWPKNMIIAPSTLLTKERRKELLGQLLQEKSSVTVNDYLEACRFAIHRRQAERDLKSFFKLKITGQTRNRAYSL